MTESNYEKNWFNDFLYDQYNYLEATFYKYTKPRYLLVESVILGSLIMSHNKVSPKFSNHLWFFSCVCLGSMIFFHDDIENISLRYNEDGRDGILNDFNEYLESKHLVAKEQYEYYKDLYL